MEVVLSYDIPFCKPGRILLHYLFRIGHIFRVGTYNISGETKVIDWLFLKCSKVS